MGEKPKFQPSFPPFTLARKTYKKGMRPEECFELFYNEEAINVITSMFNLYASQDKGDALFSTNSEEIKCWLGILMLSGYMSFHRWRMLWEYHSESYLPSVSNAMRRYRFKILKAYAHFLTRQKLTKEDKFTKIRSLLTMLNKRFLQYAIFDEKLCVDESMILYFRKHGAKQFWRGKPIRFGYKMCTFLQTYHSKSMAIAFSSVKFAKILKSKGIGYTGIVKSNRTKKAPLIDSKEMTKRSRGSFNFCLEQGEGIALITWNDIVSLVSTVDPVMPIVKTTRWIAKDAQKKQVDQSFMVSQYNHFMGGVDCMDQNINNYRIGV